MLNWIIIVLLVFAGIFAIKMNHLRHRVFIILLIFIALFFYVTLTFVTTKNEIDLATYDGFIAGVKVYGGWLANGFNNMKAVTGYAIKKDWTATNGTLLKKNNTSATTTSPQKTNKGPSVKFRKL
ncbi:MAG: hypothetical protein Q8N99_01650 [Nanoarchaeota archaeon]|nr:hypothetical protein [Nanoarchaeota archaeon]